jgi:hypothetical protein
MLQWPQIKIMKVKRQMKGNKKITFVSSSSAYKQENADDDNGDEVCAGDDDPCEDGARHFVVTACVIGDVIFAPGHPWGYPDSGWSRRRSWNIIF